MNQRNKGLDFIKGVMIIFVVYGHVLVYFTHNFNDRWDYKTIYSVHMFLLLFISGYLVSKIDFNKSVGGYFRRHG